MEEVKVTTSTAIRTKPREPKPLEMWHVILLDDNDHSYDYVIRMVQDLFACDQPRAFELAKTVDKEGRVICTTVHKELAELKRDQIHAYGKDKLIASCKGSMSAVIEPAR
jgi:ATP-dependent Clp protease adaptor protein ClpS